ncbi:MAG: hypothetical protein JW908_01195 [Anaerolineales bacterium]|nr:hypothetical protein [Anaerolineales bacterium]
MNTHEKSTEKLPEPKKSYSQPMIVYEIDLETRAGSPLGMEEDPLNLIEPQW